MDKNNINVIDVNLGGQCVTPSQSLEDLIDLCPKNQTIVDNIIIAWSKINNNKYKKILCSISGGSDSDIMLDICYRCDKDKKIDYVWFDTGIEYEVTKKHLTYLEDKYGIKIKRYKAIKSVPISCKEYGQPFLSKRVSDMICRLQRHNFKFEDKSFEELFEQYPTCKVALKWWCNKWDNLENRTSQFNIDYNSGLKKFMIQNPPTFKISHKCCDYAKKNIAKNLIKHEKYDLNIIGIRKAEGGARSTAIKGCFEEKEDMDIYRPIFWYKNSDKIDFENKFNITHSLCYSDYGLKRTGCSGCPYGKDFVNELHAIETYEPRLYKAVQTIFGDSYKYTQEYYNFVKKTKTN